MFKRILIATDGSPLSDKAVAGGLELAKVLGAKIIGYASLDRYPYASTAEFVVETPTDFREQSEAEAKAILAAMEQVIKAAGVPYDCYISENDMPYEGIIEAAEKMQCDLVVMASHGRSGLSAFLLGSETQKVLTHSKIPVLVYR